MTKCTEIKVTSLVEVRIEISYCQIVTNKGYVTSLVEVRIEIREILTKQNKASVTSLVEVRIEIKQDSPMASRCKSLPLWKCGLKYLTDHMHHKQF